MLPIFFQLKKKKGLERKTKHNSVTFQSCAQNTPLVFSCLLAPPLADQAPWTPFPILSTTWHVYSAQATGAKYHCLTEDSQVCCLGLPVQTTISRPASAPQARGEFFSFSITSFVYF